ncbi:MAG: hypothetical protein IPP46_14335 [Bacteroidetes bacterium]|nr:hypothetical protein [Bacteroidota bacterium]
MTSTGHTVKTRYCDLERTERTSRSLDCHVYGNSCCGIELRGWNSIDVSMINNNVHDNGDNGIGIVGMQGLVRT